ncbi:Rrf2 family transcriptional regulator [Janibacter melonis]|uniref:RrF2 family transcriptional regulator n=1 Tax=Janibacter melonis TaxID=262209 RepID=UPI001E5CC09A|nr:Rrf2 family transcriptional regulator [Janibacter melonis]MCB5990669.1 Rrf2 family transcriptional regulator [Janibacter melonis]
MDISARSDYAVRALLSLVAAQDGRPVSVEQLSGEQELPRKFLEAIVADLRRAGLVTSRRGAAGGYLLARPADEISVGDVIRAVDGPLAEIRGQRPQDLVYTGSAQRLPVVWVALRAALRDVLDDTSLAAIASGQLPALVQDLASRPDAMHNR